MAEEIESLEAEQVDDTILNEAYKEEIAQILVEKRAQYDTACDDPRASCPEDQKQSGESGESSNTNWMLILGIIGGLIFLALGVGLLMRGSGREENFFESEQAWSANTLPIHDTVANSMYGGAGPIFQQQMPQPVVAPVPQPVVAPLPLPVVPVGPPLPPGGLPAGWTMEQWQYYGQQYLDRLQQ